MDFEKILIVLLSATIPAIITYFVTKKNCDSKINEVKITAKHQIEQLKLLHQHEIDKINSEHLHSIDKLEMEYKLQKDTKSDDMSVELTKKLLSGDLKLGDSINELNNLGKIQKKVASMKQKSDMSGFVKKK